MKFRSAVWVTTAALSLPLAQARPAFALKITETELRAALWDLPSSERERRLKDPAIRQRLAENLLDQEALYREALRQNLDHDKELRSTVEQFRRQVLARKVLSAQQSAQFSEEAMKKYYSLHSYRYILEKIRVEHVLVKTELEAKRVLRLLQSPNASFREIAEKYSKDPTVRSNQGDLGWFSRDPAVPEFSDAVFGAPQGRIQGPLQTAYGYHVFRVTEGKRKEALPFAAVKDRVIQEMRQELARNTIANLRERATEKP